MTCDYGYYNYLLIDIDIDYNDFKQYFLDEWKELLEYVRKKYMLDIVYANMVKSKNGNTHIIIKLSDCIRQEKILLLEFLLGDDRKRVAFKLMRLKELGDIVDFFYTSKNKPEKII